jgi:hypothetical protein
LAWLGLPRTLGLAWGYYLGMKTRNLWLGLGQLINLVSKQETLGLAWLGIIYKTRKIWKKYNEHDKIVQYFPHIGR